MEDITVILDNAELLYSLEEIDTALNDIATQLEHHYADLNPIFLCVMNGSIMTTGHLLPKLNFPLELDYIHATRYGKETTGGELNWLATPKIDIVGRHVVLVEDIFDNGLTLAALRTYCQGTGVKSVKCVTLTNKLHDNKSGPLPEFVGLTLPNRYVFGFGMDYKGYLRNAPGIFAVAGS